MAIFDTNVQELKNRVLREVAMLAFDGTLLNGIADIPEKIIPGPQATMRCCIYKERAIVLERIKLALGGDSSNKNEVEVLNIACDECPVSQFKVGEACRGCIAHRCVNVCPQNAISITNHRAVIDNIKCVGCGRCLDVCPYSAIIKSLRPCERACKPGAITMDENKKAKIDNDKCIACGACVYMCPFGAIMDKSYITEAIKILKKADEKNYKVYAVIAPSVASQFGKATAGQISAALKLLGFHCTVEAALGADMVAYLEAKELREKGFLTTSCCPAFVSYVKKFYPELKKHISQNLSPMAQISKHIKKLNPASKIIFIGPCIAKKAEAKDPVVAEYVDCVITFEELQAMFDSRGIDPIMLAEDTLDNASYYGRIFARSGGVTDAVRQALKEQGVTDEDFRFDPIACGGIDECRMALLKASKNVLKENFIEGMACDMGCIGGAGCLTHGIKDKKEIDAYGHLAKEKHISDAIGVFEFDWKD